MTNCFGCLNGPSFFLQAAAAGDAAARVAVAAGAPLPRKRGRPPGSKSKPGNHGEWFLIRKHSLHPQFLYQACVLIFNKNLGGAHIMLEVHPEFGRCLKW